MGLLWFFYLLFRRECSCVMVLHKPVHTLRSEIFIAFTSLKLKMKSENLKKKCGFPLVTASVFKFLKGRWLISVKHTVWTSASLPNLANFQGSPRKWKHIFKLACADMQRLQALIKTMCKVNTCFTSDSHAVNSGRLFLQTNRKSEKEGQNQTTELSV